MGEGHEVGAHAASSGDNHRESVDPARGILNNDGRSFEDWCNNGRRTIRAMVMEDEASHQSLVPKMRARVGERAVPIVQNKIARKMAGFLKTRRKVLKRGFVMSRSYTKARQDVQYIKRTFLQHQPRCRR